MNAFEKIVASLFRTEGYWTINGYRVDLSKDGKKEIGKPSLPRPEIDILAYQGSTNELIWVECKSYLDSGGVGYASFTNPTNPGYNRFKVFNYPIYREVISRELISQTVDRGFARNGVSLKYCLVAGKVKSDKDRGLLVDYFKENGWLFYDEKWLKSGLKNAAKSQYEDDVTMITAKIIQRL